MESGRVRVQAPETFQHQPSAGKQHNRQGQFNGHKQAANLNAAPGQAERSSRAVLQNIMQIGSPQEECRSESEENAGCDRNQQDEQKHPSIESSFSQPWNGL